MNLRHPLILASNSPRRHQLMKDAGFAFETYTKPVNEDYPAHLPADTIARYLSEKKNKAYHEDRPDHIILTADTTVILESESLEKPANLVEAAEMLQQLSDRMHEVITGVSIGINGSISSFQSTTKVYFRELSPQEIQHYVEKFKPLDKAGAYGIQEWIGQVGITHIEGSYFNVVGLPIDKVYLALIAYSM